MKKLLKYLKGYRKDAIIAPCFKFIETMNMSFYLALSPAVLTLIFGFIFPRYASFIFVALMSIRLMWMSMKTLRPVQ